MMKDWSHRCGQSVLDLPFVEGVPTPEKALALSKWVRSHSDLYKNEYVKFYHGTSPSLPIETQGLKPTSITRRRSFQSQSGYVYLAATPDRAEAFGKLGNSGRCVVYEVIVLVRKLHADLDQLNNQRSVGKILGNSIGESIAYGGGVRMKGSIEPWAIQRYEPPAMAEDAACDEVVENTMSAGC